MWPRGSPPSPPRISRRSNSSSIRNAFSATAISPGRMTARADAILEFANDPRIDAIWWARGGYGTNRIAERVLAKLTPRRQSQDLARLQRCRLPAGRSLQGRCPARRPWPGGDGHLPRGRRGRHRPRARLPHRARCRKRWSRMSSSDARAPRRLQPHHPQPSDRHRLMPDLTDHVLMVEEVGEHHYRIDRALLPCAARAARS